MDRTDGVGTDAMTTGAAPPAEQGSRIPVYAVWQPEIGPVLSLGMLTASARGHRGGALEATFEIRRPELAESFLHDLTGRSGPAILLCSDYVWSVDHNLALARQAISLCPELLVIHGGPSSPKYHGDAEAFLRDHRDAAHLLVRGEGELTICSLLEALATSQATLDHEHLQQIAGLSYLHPVTDELVRTPDADRIADLDELPSPYLTGEFDHIDPAAWHYCVSIETNRGCPYGCTFCDWGSATLARIRKFDLERTQAELTWSAERGIYGVQLCDANFGIMKRDVELAAHLANLKRAHQNPRVVAFTPAKNTTKHLSQIFDELLGADVLLSTAISLQTTDPTTLERVNRSNISTDAYLALAADLRRRGQALQGDLLIGMPGQTYETYRSDLQFFMDHDIAPRTWNLRMLPNAPMNAPEYRSEHKIRTNHRHIVVATESMTEADRLRMRRLRKVQVIAWKFGTLRHLLNVLQWDHGIAATEVLEAIVVATERTPRTYPVLTWVFEYFDLFCTAALGWEDLYADVRRLVADELGASSSSIDAVLALQRALMPSPGRVTPVEIELAHDYPTYLRTATASLFETGQAGRPDRPLHEHPPVTITVTGDPHDLCTRGIHFIGDSRSEVIEGSFWIDIGFSYELPVDPPVGSAANLSPLATS